MPKIYIYSYQKKKTRLNLLGLLIKSRTKHFYPTYPVYTHVGIAIEKDIIYSVGYFIQNRRLCSGIRLEPITNNRTKHIFEFVVTQTQVDKIRKSFYDENIKYNLLGLISLLIFNKGINIKNHYVCSGWVTKTLRDAGIAVFGVKNTQDVPPCMFSKEELLRDV